ncbi:MAG: tRNA pseudouridine(38-40) synthase TruA [Candidatus Omnitrophica bacterium]|nr:tRNA pseudouridine(38-40) synthase TruA [Candidatus Omnitrophota bacterium]
MRNFQLIIEYDGTNYQGWQIQDRKFEIRNLKSGRIKTIQGEIEGALEKIFGKRIKLIGSGRTDSGVHALGQVANFRCDTYLKPLNILNALNSYLSSDVRVLKVKEVEKEFHARFSAKSKVYRYIILNHPVASVFYRNYSWWIKQRLDYYAMRRTIRLFLGKHNFKAFTTTDPKRKTQNFVRTVKKISFKKYRDFLIFEIEADGFLYKMVRNIVGTLVEVGKGKLTPRDVRNIFSTKERKFSGPSAPARGLFLLKVKY